MHNTTTRDEIWVYICKTTIQCDMWHDQSPTSVLQLVFQNLHRLVRNVEEHRHPPSHIWLNGRKPNGRIKIPHSGLKNVSMEPRHLLVCFHKLRNKCLCWRASMRGIGWSQETSWNICQAHWLTNDSTACMWTLVRGGRGGENHWQAIGVSCCGGTSERRKVHHSPLSRELIARRSVD